MNTRTATKTAINYAPQGPIAFRVTDVETYDITDMTADELEAFMVAKLAECEAPEHDEPLVFATGTPECSPEAPCGVCEDCLWCRACGEGLPTEREGTGNCGHEPVSFTKCDNGVWVAADR